MAWRIDVSRLQSHLRELERRQRQAIDDYNRRVDRYNDEVRRRNDNVRRAVADYNREVDRFNDNRRRAIDSYNHEVRAHNSRVMANRQRLQYAIDTLGRQPTTTMYTTFRISVEAVRTAYVRLEEHPDVNLGSDYDRLLDLSEREAANSVEVMNSLLGMPPGADAPADELVDARLTDELRKISPDLDSRWQGAVFALNPRNPDAARHFCTSAREIMVRILDTHAPDSVVVKLMPDCPRTEQGTPTRRAKVGFFLQRKGMQVEALEDFVEQDMENILELFRVFNDGTHGSAGTFDIPQLKIIRKRVEDAIFFLSRVMH